MRLRLYGTPAECSTAAVVLRHTPGLHVCQQRPPYAARAGELVRVYLTVDLDPAAAVGRCPACGGVPNPGVL